MWQAILTALIGSGLDFLLKFLSQKKVESEQKRREALEVAVKTAKEAEKETEEYKQLVDQYDKQVEATKDAEAQLEAIRKFNEVSRKKRNGS